MSSLSASHFNPDASERAVPCPACTTAVRSRRLAAHLRICPAAVRQAASRAMPYFSAGANTGSASVAESDTLASCGGGAVGCALRAALASTQSFTASLAAWHLRAAASSWQLGALAPADPTAAAPIGTQTRQAAVARALIATMGAFGLLVPRGRVYVECGAGRGGLSVALLTALPVPRLGVARVLLVERDASVRKVDESVRQLLLEGASAIADSSHESLLRGSFLRARVDLADLDLRGAMSMLNAEAASGSKEGGDAACIFAKHLCGAATDLALRALAALLIGSAAAQKFAGDSGSEVALDAAADVTSSGLAAFGGVALATCCHHRCSWTSYVGKPLFRREVAARGSSAADAAPALFKATSLASSWAASFGATGVRAPLPPEDDARRKFGRQCKDLLDAGRCEYLRTVLQAAAQSGGNKLALPRIGVAVFCDESLTPENRVLLATVPAC